MKVCTKLEFEEFIRAYPNKLVKDVIGFGEPPLLTYNDFTLGDWPKSIVAKVMLNTEMSWSEAYDGEPDEYSIKK